MSPGRTRALLRTLIHRCEDDIVIQKRAALDLSRAVHRARLSATTRQREAMVAELERALRDAGGQPSWFGSAFVKAVTILRRVRRMVIGQHDGDTFAVCAIMADRTSSAYESALASDISTELSTVLARQHEGVVKTYQDFRYARGAS